MPSLILATSALLAGYAMARLLPRPLAFSVALVGLTLAGFMASAPVIAGLVAGLMVAVLVTWSARRGARGGRDELADAQKRAENEIEGLEGLPGGAMHEELAIGALLAAIGANDPAEQLAGFREAEQLARQGRQTLTVSRV